LAVLKHFDLLNFIIAILVYDERQVMAKAHISFVKKNHNHRVQLFLRKK